ncbi:cyclin-dependent kinase inhibitor 3-like [Bidens hawaiensis]|uniref:cyclin-dependent kinase inhibitor 3-like n=1 Tax=Bidens hawaiensis TaxID=980011 RepID=UPI0040496DE7
MGKYIKKPKLTGPMMDATHASSLGVRTRAKTKTLALQKLQPSSNSPAAEHPSESAYLELRSRKLEKPISRRVTCCRQQNPNPNSVGSGSVKDQMKDGEETEEEGCFGENDLEFDARERSTRESTPCDSVKDFNVISTPGSSTRPRNLEAFNIIARSMPLAHEIEEFFAVHEQEQQIRFADKYNFDFVNEKPLEGCYEWVKVVSH